MLLFIFDSGHYQHYLLCCAIKEVADCFSFCGKKKLFEILSTHSVFKTSYFLLEYS